MSGNRSGVTVLLGLALVLVTANFTTAALEWEKAGWGRSARLGVEAGGKTGFTSLTSAQTGIGFVNGLAESKSLTNQVFLNGSGVAAGDVNGDGLCDLFFANLDGPNALYVNLDGWKFQERAAAAGVDCAGLDCTGAALADLDGDADLDLVVSTIGAGTLCFSNDGKGTFTPRPSNTALRSRKGRTSLALADLNGDGFLDLYLAAYRAVGLMDMPNTHFILKTVNGRQVVDKVNGRPVANDPEMANRYRVSAKGGIIENGEEDDIYLSQSGTNWARLPFTGGAFLDEDAQPLTSPPFDWGLSVMLRDLNGDLLPDIYVCNDFDSPERVWLNRGGGKFAALGRLAIRHTSLFSMGADVADINRDGYDDVLVVDMLSRDHEHIMNQLGGAGVSPRLGMIEDRPEYARNTLFLNQRDGTYAEIAQLSGLEASDWSWCVAFLDVDLDGWEDVLISNGHGRHARHIDTADKLKEMRARKKMTVPEIFEARRLFPKLDRPNYAFRNQHDLTFKEISGEWGFNFAGVSHGMALGDLDNDGDLDVAVNNLNAPASIYRNDSPAGRIAIRLQGRAPNTKGIGARIKVECPGLPSQSQSIMGGSRYLSADDPMRTFASLVGKAIRIEVTWPDRKISLIENAQANRVYEIDEVASAASPKDSLVAPQAQPGASAMPGSGQPFFKDISDALNHQHADEEYNDFDRQPLLPHRLSQPGPAAVWFDWDANGWDDLIIGAGRGSQISLFTNGPAGFGRGTFGQGLPVLTREATGLLCARPASEPALTPTLSQREREGGNGAFLFVAASNYEDGLAFGAAVTLYKSAASSNQTPAKPEEVARATASSAGALAMGDLDGDGDLDLFAAGRVIPGKFPRPASSAIYLNENGKFVLDARHSETLRDIGMVSGAVFSDLTGDGKPDLALACCWGPIRLFRNEAGLLKPWEAGLREFTGWWNGIATGDFNNDGRLDIVAGNWGRNHRYQAHRAKPLRIYHGDLDGNGIEDLIQAWFDPKSNRWLPEEQLGDLAAGIPVLKEKFPTSEAFGRASIDEIIAPHGSKLPFLEASFLETTLFLNTGDRFKAAPLPVEAQMSAVFGVVVADWNADGDQDLFLSQNFFPCRVETPRLDAGRGLLLLGDGTGRFQAVPGLASGIAVYGEQRGAATADFDRDGRADLVVTQNGAATRLYRNLFPRRGVRVRLIGPPQNPDAVGARVGWDYGETGSPAARSSVWEIQAGSGYLSQNSATLILGAKKPPKSIWAEWPGGKKSSHACPASFSAVQIDISGEAKFE